MLPLYDADGKLITLQYIDQKGVKRYHDGGPTGGRYWVLAHGLSPYRLTPKMAPSGAGEFMAELKRALRTKTHRVL